jgi:uncharacterized membrane protein YphA (DoxX/SURF4 family)
VSPTRTLARPLLASMFIAGGVDALKDPARRREQVAKAGMSDPDKLVRINAATQLIGGLALATGRLPRLSALALAGSLVPSTYIGHPFWSEDDQAAKSTERRQFVKNLSMLGGLLLAAADTGGRESIPHAAGRITRRTARQTSKAAKKASKALPHVG